MKFTKMHGIGNDYVYVNCFQETANGCLEGTGGFLSSQCRLSDAADGCSRTVPISCKINKTPVRAIRTGVLFS